MLVNRVAESIDVEVCSIFLLDQSLGEYVLRAIHGVDHADLDTVRIKKNTGLVGLVGERGTPVNLEKASGHPRFQHITSWATVDYDAFLGVPIIHQRRLLGVLSVLRQESVRFDEAEEAFLVTLATRFIRHYRSNAAFGEVEC